MALHREFGEITLAQMLNEWALHDLGHIRQVAELVRARKYQGGCWSDGRVVSSEALITMKSILVLAFAGSLAAVRLPCRTS